MSRSLRVVVSAAFGMLATLSWTIDAIAAPVPIVGLYSTGVNDAREVLADGELDPHWRVFSSTDPLNPGPNLYALPTSQLSPPWTPNTSTGRWIGLRSNTVDTSAGSTFVFEVKIDLTGFHADTAQITFVMTGDDDYNVMLNGVATGVLRSGAFTSLASHTISTGWEPGINSVRFTVQNSGGGPTGFFVSEISGFASADVTTDADSDMIADYYERLYGTNPASGDSDNDGLPDNVEDANGNGVLDEGETNALVADTDGDGILDGAEDADHDGMVDDAESDPRDPCQPDPNALKCPTGDLDGDGVNNTDDGHANDACLPNAHALTCATGDADGDGTPNETDEDPIDPCKPASNAVRCLSGDTDGDGQPNGQDSKPSDPCMPNGNVVACESGDADGDGVNNQKDSAPSDPCKPNANALECDGGDSDGDGVSNDEDEEPTNACKPSNEVKACDAGDLDGDGVPNADDDDAEDACTPDSNALRCGSGDADEDGIINALECADPGDCLDTDGDGAPDYQDTDSDDDGVSDADECGDGEICKDTDGDGIPDALDVDDDGDGINTADEDKEGDANRNGTPDYLDDTNGVKSREVDSDGDGESDADECGNGDTCLDTDKDGLPNDEDDDDDGDGIPTANELAASRRYRTDMDSDGIPNHLDANSDGDRLLDSQELGDDNNNGVPDYLEPTALYAGDDDSCSAGSGPRRDHGAWWVMTLLAWLTSRRRKRVC